MAIVLRKGENKTAAFVSNSLREFGEMFQFLSRFPPPHNS